MTVSDSSHIFVSVVTGTLSQNLIPKWSVAKLILLQLWISLLNQQMGRTRRNLLTKKQRRSLLMLRIIPRYPPPSLEDSDCEFVSLVVLKLTYYGGFKSFTPLLPSEYHTIKEDVKFTLTSDLQISLQDSSFPLPLA